jgi:U3 small nucleolar RNA-associated protein 18
MAPTAKLKQKEKARKSIANGVEVKSRNAAEDYDSEGSSAPEKDEIEEKLERLLFGDDAGFLEGLKPRSADQQLLLRPSLDAEAVEGEDEEDLGDVADENVWTAL